MSSTLVNRSKEKNSGSSSRVDQDQNESKELKGYWLSKNPSKRWGELFFLYYSIFWIGIFGAVVVTEAYQQWANIGYTLCGLAVSVPAVLYPLLFPGDADKSLPITQRYWFKANVWIAIFNFIGNYFWTHYFFILLEASYTFPITWQLNKVPIPLYLITQAYFLTYHAFTNLALRRLKTSMKPGTWRVIVMTIAVLVLAYITAFMETFTIQTVPYYSFKDRYMMYTIGSTFYGLYFVISFPMFLRLDEKVGENWDNVKTAVDSLAAGMLVFILCDFWRLALGGIDPSIRSQCVPYVYA